VLPVVLFGARMVSPPRVWPAGVVEALEAASPGRLLAALARGLRRTRCWEMRRRRPHALPGRTWRVRSCLRRRSSSMAPRACSRRCSTVVLVSGWLSVTRRTSRSRGSEVERSPSPPAGKGKEVLLPRRRHRRRRHRHRRRPDAPLGAARRTHPRGACCDWRRCSTSTPGLAGASCAGAGFAGRGGVLRGEEPAFWPLSHPSTFA
jgi:hypothetical protein